MVDDVVIIRNEEIRLAHRIVDDGSYSHPVIKCLDSKKLLITTVCNKLQRKKTYIRRIRFGFRIYHQTLRSKKKYFHVVVFHRYSHMFYSQKRSKCM